MTAKERKALLTVSFKTKEDTFIRYDNLNKKVRISHERIYLRGLEEIEKENK